MATRRVKVGLIGVIVVFVSSCAVLFKTTIPYTEKHNFLLQLQSEKALLESMENRLPPSDVDMAIRLNITLQNAVRENREPKYILFLYRIYTRKLTTLLSDAGYFPPEKKVGISPSSEAQSKKMRKTNSCGAGEQNMMPSSVTSSAEETVSPEESKEMGAPSCEFDKAVENYNDQNWQDAYQGFQKCFEAGEKVDQSASYLGKIEKRVILPDWNRANLLVYQGRSESDLQRKQEFYQQAEKILKRIEEDYPENKYSDKIEKNIQLIEKLLQQIKNKGDSGE